MPDIYKYDKTIDSKVAEAVSKILKVQVFNCTKFPKGEVNHVYKIETNKGNFVARVFRYRDWPEKDKLPWIEKQLAKSKIPHAKILYYSRSDRFFPNGLMIQTYLEGPLGTEALKRKLLSHKALYYKMGQLAARLHKITCRQLGSPTEKKIQKVSYTQLQLRVASRMLSKLTKQGVIQKSALTKVQNTIQQTFQDLEAKLHPVLLHGDLSESNVIVDKKFQLTLIDWDNAKAGIWPAEYIELERRLLLRHARNRATLKQSFYQGYGKRNLSRTEQQKVEDTLLLIRQVWQMHYYFFDRKEKQNFFKIRKIFYTLLKSQ
jgi:Ser/Thr protein kinase RdoA (MazF antagonist)